MHDLFSWCWNLFIHHLWYNFLSQWILLIKTTKYDFLSVIFCYSSLKKKLKDKMAEFQVGDQTFLLDGMFPFHCSYAISNLQFLKMYADFTGSYPSRILRGCWEACLYRFEPSFVTDQWLYIRCLICIFHERELTTLNLLVSWLSVTGTRADEEVTFVPFLKIPSKPITF